jgi:hypothetical protein
MPVGISFPLAASFCYWQKKVVEREVVEQSRLFGNAWGSLSKRLAEVNELLVTVSPRRRVMHARRAYCDSNKDSHEIG